MNFRRKRAQLERGLGTSHQEGNSGGTTEAQEVGGLPLPPTSQVGLSPAWSHQSAAEGGGDGTVFPGSLWDGQTPLAEVGEPRQPKFLRGGDSP